MTDLPSLFLPAQPASRTVATAGLGSIAPGDPAFSITLATVALPAALRQDDAAPGKTSPESGSAQSDDHRGEDATALADGIAALPDDPDPARAMVALFALPNVPIDPPRTPAAPLADTGLSAISPMDRSTVVKAIPALGIVPASDDRPDTAIQPIFAAASAPVPMAAASAAAEPATARPTRASPQRSAIVPTLDRSFPFSTTATMPVPPVDPIPIEPPRPAAVLPLAPPPPLVASPPPVGPATTPVGAPPPLLASSPPVAPAGAPVDALRPIDAASAPVSAITTDTVASAELDTTRASAPPIRATPGAVPSARLRAILAAVPVPLGVASALPATHRSAPVATVIAAGVAPRSSGLAATIAERPRPARFAPTDALLSVAVAPTAAPADQPALDLADRRWPAAMIDRIEQLRDAADAADTRIRVVPDALGPIDVAVRRNGGAIDVAFIAQHEVTRTLLAEAQPVLAAIASERGMTIGAAKVDAPAAPTAVAAHESVVVPVIVAPASTSIDQPRGATPPSSPPSFTGDQQPQSPPQSHQPPRAMASPPRAPGLPAADADDASASTRIA